MNGRVELKKRRPLISFSWKEGRYLDAWSVVHFVFGGILALAISFGPLSPLWAFALAAVLMIFWELFELYMDIGESLENIFSDIAVGILGYAAAIEFLPLSGDGRVSALIALLVIVGILDIFGWKAFLKRTGETPKQSIKEKKELLKKRRL